MQNELISVIVPVYNVEAYLDRCINSIATQSYQRLEIILIDDGSTDHSGQLCDQWQQKDKRIVVLHKENGGLSSARNAGLDLCHGAYLSFVDSDDWIEPNFYSKMLSTLENANAELVCAGRFDVYETTGKKQIGLCPRTKRSICTSEMLQKMLTWDECDSSVCDKIYAAILWDRERFPVGTVSEDVAVMYRVVARSKGIRLLPEPLYNYYHRQGSISTSSFSEKSNHIVETSKTIERYIQEHYPDCMAEAKYFRLKSLLYWLQKYSLQDVATKSQYTALYRKYYQALSSYKFYILLQCPYASFKEKVLYLLLLFKQTSLLKLLSKH